VSATTGELGVSRGVLSDQVKDRLLRGIMEGTYPPGSRIVETRVARDLGTSQAPVREALRDLEALGVVEIEAFRGARVRQPSAAELTEAFDVRAEIEMLAVRQATPNVTAEDFAALDRCVLGMEQAAEMKDPHAHAVNDAQFHARVVAASGNKTLSRLWSMLEPFGRTYITVVSPGIDLPHLAHLHADVEEALRGGDPERAVEAMRQHFVEAGRMLRSRWASEFDTTGEGG
jgi:DNA-binding GntR family transcriptional regulator